MMIFFCAVLIRDLALDENSTTKTIWQEIVTTPLINNTVRTPLANITLYIRSILHKKMIGIEVDGVIRSNDNPFSISCSEGQLRVSIDILRQSKYSVHVIDLNSNQTYTLVATRMANEGNYIHTVSLPQSTYIVKYTLNGNINCKKITIL